MAAHTIRLWVVDSTFYYSDQTGNNATAKHAKKNEHIGWESWSGENFTIVFPANNTPFASNSFTSNNGRVPPQKVDKAYDPGKHHYKYTVTILPSGPSDDPEIIIDPNGGY